MSNKYSAAQKAAELRRLIAGIGNASDTMLSRIAGFQPQTAMQQQRLATADDPLDEAMAADQAQRQLDAAASEQARLQELNDPTSRTSHALRGLVSKYGAAAPENLSAQAIQANNVLGIAQRDAERDEARLFEAEQADLRLKAQQDQKDAYLKYLYDKLGRKGKGGGSVGGKKLSVSEKKTEENKGALSTITDQQIDTMDLTPVQRAAARAARDTGNITAFNQIAQEEAHVQSERAKPGVGKAGVADYQQVIDTADSLLAQAKGGKNIEGLGGDFASRANMVDIPFDGGVLEDLVQTGANLVSSDKAKLNRQLFSNLAAAERNELFGGSLTGSEKTEARKLSGMRATASPQERIAYIKRLRDKAQSEINKMQAGRRNPLSPLSAQPKKIRVRDKVTGQTGTLDSESEFDPSLYERL